MKKYWRRLIIIINFISVHLLCAQDTIKHNLDNVIISAAKTPVTFENSARNIEIISHNKINSAPVSAPEELLKYSAGIDIKTRGGQGAQSDIAINGGTFEQTLILIDGFKFIDPQTGHHNLNLPLTKGEIERIEALKGHGSQIYGANAFGGLINFITKRSFERGLAFSSEGGNNNYYDLSVNAFVPTGNFYNRFSLSKRKSDGWRHNSNYNIQTASYNLSHFGSFSAFQLFLGIIDKDLGANGFYSDKYPNQYESINSELVGLSTDFHLGDFIISAKSSYRYNRDKYLLDYEQPDFYRNNHKSETYGVDIGINYNSSLGIATIGGEYNFDMLESTNLGDRKRERRGLYFELNRSCFSNSNLIFSTYFYNYNKRSWKALPSISFLYKINETARLSASIGKSFRIPSFTEMYYASPINASNENLLPEEALSFEAGGNITCKTYDFSLHFFHRKSENLIDWIRNSDADKWRSENISQIAFYGFEVSISKIFVLDSKILNDSRFEIKYKRIEKTETEVNFQSRYLFDYLQDQAIISIDIKTLNLALLSLFGRYERRYNLSDRFILDFNISCGLSIIEFYLRMNNVFNKNYCDFSGLPLQGRFTAAGIKKQINF